MNVKLSVWLIPGQRLGRQPGLKGGERFFFCSARMFHNPGVPKRLGLVEAVQAQELEWGRRDIGVSAGRKQRG